MLPRKEQHATLSPLTRSACKYCSISCTHTHSGGVGCRADRKRRTEVSNKRGGKRHRRRYSAPDENNRSRQQPGLNTVRFLLMYKVSNSIHIIRNPSATLLEYFQFGDFLCFLSLHLSDRCSCWLLVAVNSS